MALIAHLKFGDVSVGKFDRVYDILSVKSSFKRESVGLVSSSDCHCGGITVELIAPDNSDLWLYQWYVDKESVSGCIEMVETGFHGEEFIRTLEFEDARCHSIKHSYDVARNWQVLMKIDFIAQKVTAEGVSSYYCPIR